MIFVPNYYNNAVVEKQVPNLNYNKHYSLSFSLFKFCIILEIHMHDLLIELVSHKLIGLTKEYWPTSTMKLLKKKKNLVSFEWLFSMNTEHLALTITYDCFCGYIKFHKVLNHNSKILPSSIS